MDGIFISYSLQPLQAGYFPFGEIQFDHRALWLGLHVHQVFGFKPPTTVTPNARRLQSNVPHIRNKWISLCLSFLHQHHLIERQFNLESKVSTTMTRAQALEYEKKIAITS